MVNGTSRVQNIEEAIQQLSPDEFAQLTRWIQELDQERWDERLDADAVSGNLIFYGKRRKKNEERAF